MNTYEIAKKYLELGFSVIPIKNGDKKPAGEWLEYQKRLPTLQEIEGWFSGGIKNMAVVTGKVSGITVVDLDSYKSAYKDVEIDSPLKVTTPHGGTHLYFAYTSERKGENEHLAVDIRGDGGYVLLPPSEVDGKIYKTKQKFTKELLQVLPPLPQEIYKRVQNERQQGNFQLSANLGVSTGGRNDALYRTAVSLLSKLPQEKWESEGYSTIAGVNSQYKPPLKEFEMRSVFKSATQFVRNNPPSASIRPVFQQSKPAQRTQEIDYAGFSNADFANFTRRKELSTGLPSLDRMFPFPAGFYVICGNPGTGKGFFASWLSRVFFERHSIKSVFFSLEMPEPLVRMRLLQSWSDLTLSQFNAGYSTQKAVALLKKGAVKVFPFGLEDTSYQTPENFKKDFEKFYQEGYRIFHFDHIHELEGASVNDTNMAVMDKWGLMFQNLTKQYPDVWLFIFAQPNAGAEEKTVIRKTDVLGSKIITRKCEFFLSLNREAKIDIRGIAQVNEQNRRIVIWLDKNRVTDRQLCGCELYFHETGNFVELADKTKKLLTSSTHEPISKQIRSYNASEPLVQKWVKQMDFDNFINSPYTWQEEVARYEAIN